MHRCPTDKARKHPGDEKSVRDQIGGEKIRRSDDQIDDVMLVEIYGREPNTDGIEGQQGRVSAEIFIDKKGRGHRIGPVQRRDCRKVIGIKAAPERREKIHADHPVDIDQGADAKSPGVCMRWLAEAVAVHIPGRRRRIQNKSSQGREIQQSHGPDKGVKHFTVVTGMPKNPADDDGDAKMQCVKKPAGGIEDVFQDSALDDLLKILQVKWRDDAAKKLAEQQQLDFIGQGYIDRAGEIIGYAPHHIITDPKDDPGRPVDGKFFDAAPAERQAEQQQGDKNMIGPHAQQLIDEDEIDRYPRQNIAAPAL